jgi:hypothetical protein
MGPAHSVVCWPAQLVRFAVQTVESSGHRVGCFGHEVRPVGQIVEVPVAGQNVSYTGQ